MLLLNCSALLCLALPGPAWLLLNKIRPPLNHSLFSSDMPSSWYKIVLHFWADTKRENASREVSGADRVQMWRRIECENRMRYKLELLALYFCNAEICSDVLSHFFPVFFICFWIPRQMGMGHMRWRFPLCSVGSGRIVRWQRSHSYDAVTQLRSFRSQLRIV